MPDPKTGSHRADCSSPPLPPGGSGGRVPETVPPAADRRGEIEVRADQVKPGDYLLGLGRVQSYSEGAGRVALASEGNDWRVRLDPRHRVVVLR